MKALRDIPNQDGFKFIGIDKQGNEHFCIVRKKSGRYVMNSNTVVWADLAGWLNVEDK